MNPRMLKSALSTVFAAVTLSVAAGESYNVFFVSDLHFGDRETFAVSDPATGKLRTKKDPDRMAKLLPDIRKMFRHMAERFDARTAFVVQGGDLVEGYAKDQDAHAAQLRQALAEMTALLPRPVVGVNGNHDSNGKFGRAAFKAVMLPHLRQALARPDLNDPFDFTIRKGDDLWIFTDYFSDKPSKTRLDYPIRVLRELQWRPRYVFLVVHSPLIQLPNRKHDRMLDELAKHRSFIICGHTHQNMLLVAKRSGNRITQFSINSFFNPRLKQNRFAKTVSTLELFLPHLKRRSEKFNLWDRVQAEVVPALVQVWFAKGGGYAKLDISDAGVAITAQSFDLSQDPVVVLPAESGGRK